MNNLFDDDEDGWEEDDDFLNEPPELPAEPFEYAGNTQVIQQLNTLISSDRMPHALMFCGEQGIGKFTLAEALAHSLLSSQTEVMFKEDAILGRMHSGSHSDYLIISGANNEKSKQDSISVDQVRSIGSFLSKTPGEAPLRVIIIDGAESMNTNASNALLKNLEEPPANTLIILISHNQANLLPTIRSRVQMMKFSPLTIEDCATVIKKNMEATDMAHEADIALISDLADARPGLAIKWLDSGAADMYRSWLKVVSGSADEHSQLARVVVFASEITKDKQTIHSNMDIFSTLLLLFVKRAALSDKLMDDQEKQAIESWRAQINTKEMISSWFLLKDQFSLVQKLHLEYTNTLITTLLRLVRGQEPLEIIHVE